MTTSAHLDNSEIKNRILRSDDWMLNRRWDQIFAMRDSIQMVEIETWNDYGESTQCVDFFFRCFL